MTKIYDALPRDTRRQIDTLADAAAAAADKGEWDAAAAAIFEAHILLQKAASAKAAIEATEMVELLVDAHLATRIATVAQARLWEMSADAEHRAEAAAWLAAQTPSNVVPLLRGGKPE